MMYNWKNLLFCGLPVIFAAMSLLGDVHIRSLTWRQRWPWNGKVDITYFLECDEKNWDGTPVESHLTFSGYDRDMDRVIEMNALSGAGVDWKVTAGGPYKVVWDGDRDCPELHTSAFSIKAVAVTQPKAKPEPDRYLVIDLSGGSQAENFPFRYTDRGPDISKDICRTTELWLRKIPAGIFMMGAPKNELGYRDSEELHQVKLTKSFYIGMFEVTQKQWMLVMGDHSNPSKYKGDDRPVENVTFSMIRGGDPAAGDGWPEYGYHVDAGSFLGRLQEKTGLGLDLPTEAQWEYACRAGTSTALNSDKNLLDDNQCDRLDELGRNKHNQKDGKGGYCQHARVGSYRPNSWELFDMHGNIREICLDWRRDSLGQTSVVDPVGGTRKDEYKVARGGAWTYVASACRSACRLWYTPGRADEVTGLRVALPGGEYIRPKPGNYVVIDLSGGADAKSYPYRRSITGPDIAGDACRTTELWLREIPAGTFYMGSPAYELGNYNDEVLHKVTLTDSFYMGVFEVTLGQWQQVMGSQGIPIYQHDAGRPVDDISYSKIRGTSLSAGGGWPVHGHKVDSESFLGRLQAKTGLQFDLPTEAQWEYACRAGTDTALNSGKNLETVEECSNLADLGRYCKNEIIMPENVRYQGWVGNYLPNVWGLYDMHGNVGEWCLDWYQEFIPASQDTNPSGPEYGDKRVLRGGACKSIAADCRSASRYSMSPNRGDSRNGTGFRVMFTEEAGKNPRMGKYLVIDLSMGANASKYGYYHSDKEPDLTSNDCRTSELWLRKIPAGTFMMGAPANMRYCTSTDFHKVTLTQSFYMGVFEVTQDQWKRVMGKNPSDFPGFDRPVESVSYALIRGTGKNTGGSWPSCNHQVDNDSFIGKLQERTGLILDLPTEGQWEYACRAGMNTSLNSGKNLTAYDRCPNMKEVGRYSGNVNDYKGEYGTHTRVGCYLPNAWGLYDMHGNVREWCLDWYQSSTGEVPVKDPCGPLTGDSRMTRGGSWQAEARFCCSSERDNGIMNENWQYNDLGVRLALPVLESVRPMPVAGGYLVIDLSEGPRARSYPVRYSSTGPNMNGDTCRTMELWLRKIPAGGFTMGSPVEESGPYEREDMHLVTLSEDFYIGIFEVTQKQWMQVMGYHRFYRSGDDRPAESLSYDMIRGKSLDKGGGWPEYEHSVDRESFLGKLQEKTGLILDLPTEAQWEYSCRAGTRSALNSGKNLMDENGVSNLNELGRYARNEEDNRGGYSYSCTRVGCYLPNAWGLYDMHGNEEEWCLDWYQMSLGTQPIQNPRGALSGQQRVVRGGSWKSNLAEECRSARRNSLLPTENKAGFRLVCLPKTQP